MMQATKLSLKHAACVASRTLGLSVIALSLAASSAYAKSNSNAQAQMSALSELEQRVQPFLDSDNAFTQYQATKARMWLTYVANERSERSLSLAAQQSQAQAEQLIEQLEQTKIVSASTTPIIASSKVMRRDLWVNAELLKQQPGFECAASEIAQAEVTLVWAAAEHCELGWHHSRESFASAERLIDQANYKVLNCNGMTGQSLPKIDKASYPSLEQLNGMQKGCHGVAGQWPIIAVPASQLISAPPVMVSAIEPAKPVMSRAIIELPNVVHFALDQSTLSTASRDVLSQIATVLVDEPQYSITLYGYSDARGDNAYNQALSKRRANAVEQYLTNHGVVASRIATVAEGEQDLISDPVAIIGHALSRRVTLVYSSADGQEINTVSQRDDLQLER